MCVDWGRAKSLVFVQIRAFGSGRSESGESNNDTNNATRIAVRAVEGCGRA